MVKCIWADRNGWLNVFGFCYSIVYGWDVIGRSKGFVPFKEKRDPYKITLWSVPLSVCQEPLSQER